MRLVYSGILIVTALAWAVAQWGDDAHWIVSLASSGATGTFILPMGIVGAYLAFRKKWLDLGVCFAGSLAVLVLTGQFPVHIGADRAEMSVKIMTFNIEHGRHGVDKIAQLVKDEKIDAFGFQECGLGTDRAVIDKLKELLPEYHLFSDGSRTSGTRLNVVSERVLPLDDLPYSWTMLEQVVSIDGHTLRVLNAHSPSYLPDATLKRPVKDWFRRWGEVARQQTGLIQYELRSIKAEGLPTVLCCDMNMPPVGKRYKLVANDGTDSFAAVGTGPGWTSPAVFPTRRIDYVWTFPGCQPTSSYVVNRLASDHAAVVTCVSFDRP